MSAVGVVRGWNSDEGWGVVDVDEVDGGVWAHFSAIEGQAFRQLSAGETVIIEWEPVPHPPHPAQAIRITVDEQAESSEEADAVGVLNSQLTITWDADTEDQSAN